MFKAQNVLFTLSIIFSGIPVAAYGTTDEAPLRITHNRDAEKASPLAQRFLTTTGLTLGEYILKKGPSECPEGDLYLLDFKDELTLMMGSHPLVLSLGAPPSKHKERACEMAIESRFEKNLIETTTSETCELSGEKMVRKKDVKLRVLPKTLEIQIIDKVTGAKATRNLCTLKLNR